MFRSRHLLVTMTILLASAVSHAEPTLLPMPTELRESVLLPMPIELRERIPLPMPTELRERVLLPMPIELRERVLLPMPKELSGLRERVLLPMPRELSFATTRVVLHMPKEISRATERVLLPMPKELPDSSERVLLPMPKELPATAEKASPIIAPAAIGWALGDKMPVTGLAPAKLFSNLCVYKYRATTTSVECQQFIDQGLGYFYSYVWIEAARSFETALRYDPQCALAYWGLSRSLEKWGRDSTKPLQRAEELSPRAGHREQLLITARCQEKGIAPNTPPEERKKKAQATLDELLTIYEDDEEGWFARAQVSDGNAAIPYYKALLRINPLHPGANHELVHFYEGFRRPALGWQYAEGYIASSPGIPHAFHMQAHLAMRIGKWDKTSDRSWRALELEKEYHTVQGVKPNEDHQFMHHMETLTRSLVHDGRFAEARQIKQEAESYRYSFTPEWYRMFLAENDWVEAENIVTAERKKNKDNGSYYAAVMYLDRGDVAHATAEIDVLRQAAQQKKSDKRLEMRLWEVQGRLLCQTGSGEAGLKLIQRAVEKTKSDYNFHAWGSGAYYMEVWGMAALECGNAAEAEEGFLEALAHDAGSVQAALGMVALCERLNRRDEMLRYEALAHRCWSRADPHHFDQMKQEMARRAKSITSVASQP